ncbi:AAA ATPase [Coemansia sp. Benny D115]|nr:AAA ATPase [Coemansia sp. Benny D115]
MPAARSTRASVRKQALAEAPISRQTIDTSNALKPVTASLKATFQVTKTNNPALGKQSVSKPKALSNFTAVKTVFHRSTAAPQIIGREAEQATIRQFLRDTIEANHGGSMYISGNPGTGKTACLQAIIRSSSKEFSSVLVNCVPLTHPNQVYKAILDALLPKQRKSEQDALAELEKLVFESSKAFLVILDEVDSLLGSRQEVLYRLFEMAAHPDSRVVLVGIANALDLTDRFLPRLQARNCVPVLLNFNPYQVQDIVSILQSRLDSVASAESTEGAAAPVIQKNALELCARKVAATSGDLRKALDVCRQAMEAAESDCKRKASLADKENPSQTTIAASPKVSIMHIAKVLNKLNGSGATQKLEALNFQQKLVLHSLLGITAENVKSKRPCEVSALYAEYGKVCSRVSMMAPVSRSEFSDLISMMETQGILAVEVVKAGRGRRRITSTVGAADDRTVRLVIDEADIRRVLTNTAQLRPFL